MAMYSRRTSRKVEARQWAPERYDPLVLEYHRGTFRHTEFLDFICMPHERYKSYGDRFSCRYTELLKKIAALCESVFGLRGNALPLGSAAATDEGEGTRVTADKGCLSEDTARTFLLQILEAARHCHSRGVLHMDLKEENILVDLDTEKLKLIDFGSAHPISDDVHSEFYGTKAYRPPERISSGGLFCTRPAEVWSLLYSMVHGNVPFEENSEIVQGRLQFKTGLSDTCRDLILRCL
ncbi:hypothetical protein Q5P01_020015 [Channa striata]|uniref:non-specific serine/threonine protein kinase n=1 Tax=Channa striata TaxID=64152 RepID=A0AA88LWS1_CHASR|nr:hypothetical protein Q5P01_020015 [Channa striata]